MFFLKRQLHGKALQDVSVCVPGLSMHIHVLPVSERAVDIGNGNLNDNKFRITSGMLHVHCL